MKQLSGSERSQRPMVIPKGAIRLEMGEPHFSTPVHIQEAAARAIGDNYTHYGSAYREPALREAVCVSLKRDFGVEREPENVLITSGGIAGVHTICATYLNAGDEVLIPDPEYSAYADSVSLFGGTPIFVPLNSRRTFTSISGSWKNASPRRPRLYLSQVRETRPVESCGKMKSGVWPDLPWRRIFSCSSMKLTISSSMVRSSSFRSARSRKCGTARFC